MATGDMGLGEALGMIETRGLVAMIEAADAMVKAAAAPEEPPRVARPSGSLVKVMLYFFETSGSTSVSRKRSRLVQISPKRMIGVSQRCCTCTSCQE